MSQHLITEFLNRTYVFKPFNGAKIVNHRVKKYQGSNRKNHVSPEMIAESTHSCHKIQVKKTQEDKQQGSEADKHIDIVV